MSTNETEIVDAIRFHAAMVTCGSQEPRPMSHADETIMRASDVPGLTVSIPKGSEAEDVRRVLAHVADEYQRRFT